MDSESTQDVFEEVVFLQLSLICCKSLTPSSTSQTHHGALHNLVVGSNSAASFQVAKDE